MLSTLTIQLFGAPQVAIDGRPLITDTRKATALLAYLAVTRQPQTRDALATLLWPELDQSRARAALRRTLSALNAAAPLPWLRAEREQVTLVCDDTVGCDIHRFERCIAACPPGEALPCDRCRVLLEEAARLCHDDFMAGFTLRDSAAFDDWQFFQAEGYRNALARVLETLVRCASYAHDWPAAIGHARRWLAIDPLHEPAQRQLMLLYAWDNQRTAALRQYQECMRILDDELGVPPLAETATLYTAILNHQTPPAPVRAADPPRTPEAPAALLVTPPLVGREADWAALLAAYGGGRLVVIEGEAGVGKTALVTAFCAVQAQTGTAVLTTVCYAGEASLAYAPLSMLLQHAAADPARRARLAALAPVWLAEVCRLQPALLPLLDRAQAEQPPEHFAAQSRFFDGLTHAVSALLAGAAPGLLVIDDVHLADSATLDWLTYFVRRLAAHRLCVVLVWRVDEVPAGHRLRQLMSEHTRQGATTVIELDRLAPAAVARWVALAVPDAADSTQLAQRLYAETEGLPYFVAEYLNMLTGDEQAWRGSAWPAPTSVRDFLHARLAPLAEVTRQVLAAAAVIGRSFDLATVTAVSGRSDDEVIAALEELLAHRLVLEAEGEWLDFAHAQLRQVIYAGLTQLRRRLLHRRVGDAVAMQARRSGREEEVAGLLAHHYALGAEMQRAAHFAFIAGEQARRVYANQAAIGHFELALTCGAPEPCAIYAHLGDLHTLLGAYGRAEQAYTAALAACPGDQRADLEQRLGRLATRRGDAAAAASHFEAAYALLPAAATLRRAQLLIDWSLTMAQAGELAIAVHLAGQGLTAAQAADDAAALARVQALLCGLARRQGDVSAALVAGEASVAAARQQQDAAVLVAALNSLALVYADHGAPDAAIPLVQEALAQVVRMGDRHREAALRNTLADLHHACGAMAEAMDQLKQAVIIFAEIGSEIGADNAGIWMLREW